MLFMQLSNNFSNCCAGVMLALAMLAFTTKQARSQTTELIPADCGSTNVAFSDMLQAINIGAAQYEFYVTDGGPMSETYSTGTNSFSLESLTSNVQYNTTYTIRVRGFLPVGWTTWGDPCDVTTEGVPTISLNALWCNANNVAMEAIMISETVPNATAYEFKITDNNSFEELYLSNNNGLELVNLNGPVEYGIPLGIFVRAIVNGEEGQFDLTPCTITTAPHPIIKLEAPYCNIQNVELDALLLAEPVHGASIYDFNISDGASYSETISRPDRNLKLNLFNGPIAYNTPYQVKVRTTVGSGTSNFGPGCNLTTIPPPAYPVSLWKMDTCWGTILQDAVGNNVGTFTAGSWDRGYSYQATSFDGSIDPATIPHDASLDITDDLSITFWVKGSAITDQAIIGKNASSSKSWLVTSDGTTGDHIRVLTTANGTTNDQDYVTTATVFDDTWHHVGITFNQGSLKIYVDGQEDNPTKVVDNTISSLNSNTAPIGIGGLTDAGFAQKFTGKIDEAAIYGGIIYPYQMQNLAATQAVPVGCNEMYAILNRQLDGGYYDTNENLLLVRYFEAYNSQAIDFKVYDQSHEIQVDETVLPVQTDYGLNLLVLSFSTNSNHPTYLANGTYILEVTNAKKERSYLRFNHQNP